MNKQELIEKLKSKAKPHWLDEEVYGDNCIKSVDLCMAIYFAEQLDGPEKPAVPRCVADMIVKRKKRGDSLVTTLAYLGSFGDAQRWILEGDNGDTFARAWLFGYEVEKEEDNI